MVFLCLSPGLLYEQSKDVLKRRKFVLIFGADRRGKNAMNSRKTYWAHKLETIECFLPSPIDLLPGAQHPQPWLPSCWRVKHKVQRELQDPASSARSPSFRFLLMCKEVSARLLTPAWPEKQQPGAGGRVLCSSCAQQVSPKADKWRYPNTSNQSSEAQNC